MRQTHDDEIDECDCPRKEGGGVGPVRHRKMPLLEPPQRNKDTKKSKTNDGTPKGDPLDCWTNYGCFGSIPNRQ